MSRPSQWQLHGRGSGCYETGSGIFYTDAELHAVRGEKEKSLAALKSMLTLPDGWLNPDRLAAGRDRRFAALESVRDTPGFDEFRQEAARRRAIMKRRVEVMREQPGLAAE